jgi:hypothetical protein
LPIAYELGDVAIDFGIVGSVAESRIDVTTVQPELIHRFGKLGRLQCRKLENRPWIGKNRLKGGRRRLSFGLEHTLGNTRSEGCEMGVCRGEGIIGTITSQDNENFIGENWMKCRKGVRDKFGRELLEQPLVKYNPIVLEFRA